MLHNVRKCCRSLLQAHNIPSLFYQGISQSAESFSGCPGLQIPDRSLHDGRKAGPRGGQGFLVEILNARMLLYSVFCVEDLSRESAYSAARREPPRAGEGETGSTSVKGPLRSDSSAVQRISGAYSALGSSACVSVFG